MYKNSYNPEKKNPVKNWAEDLNRQFSKEDIDVFNSYVKRCLTSGQSKSKSQ